MAEKKKLKTTEMGGKGGSIVSLRHKGGLFYFISLVLIFNLAFHPVAFAARSYAGGGKMAKADYGKIATNVGLTIGLAIVTAGIGSGWQAAKPDMAAINRTANAGALLQAEGAKITSLMPFSMNGMAMQETGRAMQSSAFAMQQAAKSTSILTTTGHFLTNTPGIGGTVRPLAAIGNSLGSGLNLSSIATGYSTFVAASQVSRAVGMMGSYYGWKPSTTFMLSSLATGATAGFINPSVALGEAFSKVTVENFASQAALEYSLPVMLKGAVTGGLGGLASSAAIVAIDGKKINQGKAPGVAGQIAGMVAGEVGAQFGRDFFNYDTWHKKPETIVTEKVPLEAAREDFWGDVDLDTDQLYDAVNGIEADLTGNDALRTNYVEQDLPIITDQYGERHTYFLTTEKDGRMISGTHIPDRVFNRKYGSERYLWEPTGIPKVYKISDTAANLGLGTVVGRLAKGVFVDTFNAQNWPLLASRSLGIVLSSKLSEDKQYLAPLVNSLAVSVSHPVLSGLAEVYGLDASRYFGGKFDKLEANLKYAYNPRMMAKESILSETSAKMDQETKKYTATVNDLKTQFEAGVIKSEDYTAALSKEQDKYRQALAHWSIDKDKEFFFLPPEEEFSEQPELLGSDIPIDPLERKEFENVMARLKEDYKKGNFAIATRNTALAQEGKRLETKMALDQSLSDALAKVGINKGDLFISSALDGMRSGIFEGLISGGTEAAFEKMTKNSDPTQKMLLAYAANMSTAAIRGIAWDAGWGTTKNVDWYDHWDLVKPQPYQETQYIRDSATGQLVKNPNFDLLESKISEATYDEEMLRYNRFLAVTGLTEGAKLRPTWVYDSSAVDNGYGGLVKKQVEVKMVTLGLKDKFENPLGASFAQANTEWANNALTFGRPLTHYRGEAGFGIEPQQVSALRFMDYVSSLRNLSSTYSQGGLASVIANSFTQANLDAVANNIAGALVQVPSVANTFSLQPERLVKTDAPQLPYTIQRASFHAGVTESIFRAPFPDPLYGIRPQTGEGDYLRRKGLVK